MMKFLLYIVGLRRTSGAKSGEFLYSPKHDKFIYQGRELEMDEFNQLMEKQWPLQRMANQQVSGFAFIPADVKDGKTTEPKFFEFPLEPTIEVPVDDEGLIDEQPADEPPAEETPETDEEPTDTEAPAAEEPTKATRTKKNK